MSPTWHSPFDALSVAFDPESAQWRFAGRPPGPAGIVTLNIVDDVQLVVDAVEPDRIVELTVDLERCDPTAPPSALARRLVAALLGEPFARHLVARHDGVVTEVDGSEIDPGTVHTRTLAGRLALLCELRYLEEPDDPVSPWWAVEEVCLRAALAEVTGIVDVGATEHAATEAAEFVGAFADRSVGALSPDQRRRLVRRLRALARIVGSSQPHVVAALGRLEGPLMIPADDVAPAFTELTADLPDYDERDLDRLGLLQPAALTLLGGDGLRPRTEPEARDGDHLEPEEPVRFFVEHDDDLAPGIVAPSSRIMVDWYRQRDEIRASVTLRPGVTSADVASLWVRVHVRSPDRSPYLVDMSQTMLDPDHPDHAIARLLVSHEFSSGQLLVDVTLDPAQPALTPASRARHRAVRLALDAAARERRRATRVTQGWIACHEEWIAAGDHGRAALALARAARGLADDPLALSLFEKARELLGAAGASWAEDYIGQLADVAEPFDREVFEPGAD